MRHGPLVDSAGGWPNDVGAAGAPRQRDYDLIITDYAMPLMSGSDMLKQARKLRSDIPGIIISGYADNHSMLNKPPEVVVLTKPFSADQIDAAICTVFRGCRAERELKPAP